MYVRLYSFSPQEWQINRLSYEYDSEPFGKERDAAIQKLACEAGVEVTVLNSHTLYDLSRWASIRYHLNHMSHSNGCETLRIVPACSVFVCLMIIIFLPYRIIELNDGHPPLTYKRFQGLINRMDAVELPAETVTLEVLRKCDTPVSDDHDDKFGVPSLEELGKFLSLSETVCVPD